MDWSPFACVTSRGSVPLQMASDVLLSAQKNRCAEYQRLSSMFGAGTTWKKEPESRTTLLPAASNFLVVWSGSASGSTNFPGVALRMRVVVGPLPCKACMSEFQWRLVMPQT